MGTGLGRHMDKLPNMDHIPASDILTVQQGGANVIRAIEFDVNEFPEDKERIFLTSQGTWWEKDVYRLSLDHGLQDRWCPDGVEEIERDAGT